MAQQSVEESRLRMGRGRAMPLSVPTDLLPSVKESLEREYDTAVNRINRDLQDLGNASVEKIHFAYSLAESGVVVITECLSDISHIEVPDELNGFKVRGIGSHAFSKCYSLRHIVLPEGMEEIDEFAFMNTALEEFVAPKGLERIGKKAFYKCSHLERVELGDCLTEIGESAFENTKLESLTIPPQVYWIGTNAFLHSNLSFVGPDATLRIHPDNPYYLLRDGALYRNGSHGIVLDQFLDDNCSVFYGMEGMAQVGHSAFAHKSKLKLVVLPEGVTHIGANAFKRCTSLVRVELPSTLASMGKQVFWSSTVAELDLPASLVSLGTSALVTAGDSYRGKIPTLTKLTVDPANPVFNTEGGVLYEKRMDGTRKALLYIGPDTDVVFPDDVTDIGPYAFANVIGISSIELHDGIKTVDVAGLAVGSSIPAVRIRSAEAPHGVYHISFPRSDIGRADFRKSFNRGRVSAKVVFGSADDAILATRDLYRRSRAMIKRLYNPIFMEEHVYNIFIERLCYNVAPLAVEFGRNGYLQGLNELVELGVLGSDNIEEALEAVIEADEVAATSILMEIRRKRFDAPMFDFSL